MLINYGNIVPIMTKGLIVGLNVRLCLWLFSKVRNCHLVLHLVRMTLSVPRAGSGREMQLGL